MNTIFSLLSMQAESYENITIQNILRNAAGQVQSMMILYDKIYCSDLNNVVSLKDYFTTLIKDIVYIFPQTIPLKLDIQIDDNIFLDEKELSPLGIIINELITNSIKYAFKNRDEGNINVEVRKKESLIIFIYKDDGVGFSESITIENSKGFGLQLIGMLVKQINGSITLDNTYGTKYIIEFNEK